MSLGHVSITCPLAVSPLLLPWMCHHNLWLCLQHLSPGCVSITHSLTESPSLRLLAVSATLVSWLCLNHSFLGCVSVTLSPGCVSHHSFLGCGSTTFLLTVSPSIVTRLCFRSSSLGYVSMTCSLALSPSLVRWLHSALNIVPITDDIGRPEQSDMACKAIHGSHE